MAAQTRSEPGISRSSSSSIRLFHNQRPTPSSLSAQISEICDDQIVKHHSCQPIIGEDSQANQKSKSIIEAEDMDKRLVSPYFLDSSPHHQLLKLGTNCKESLLTVHSDDLHSGQIKMKNSSPPHIPARHCSRRNKKHRTKDEETSDPEIIQPSLGRDRVKRRLNCRNGVAPQQGKLDTNMFESHLENLWRSFSDDKKNSFACLDCLWFSLYIKESSKAKVLNWIKKIHIFSKNYVFVPIVQWCHWSLLVFCHFGESKPSKSRTPCMLLLDSLQTANPQRLEPSIRKFVLDIYKTEERAEDKELIYGIPLKVPKVPQQRNNECGIFVLYYMYLFMESAPENFSIVEGYPYFMKEDWFSPKDLACFHERLGSF
ncbi:Ulp1 peptidase [Bertholletia excelsa]